jgi:hypothetical protein
LLGFYNLLERGSLLGPTVFFCDAFVEAVKPFQYLATLLGVHRCVPSVPFEPP